MIVSISPQNKVLPHFDNILQIHKNNSVLSGLDKFNPIYAGGYPMALVFAPRVRNNHQKIRRGFYSDYDVYFPDEDSLEKALKYMEGKWMESFPMNWCQHITDNAVTYVIAGQDPTFTERVNSHVQVQLIKKVISSPTSVVSSFDFINCAIAFTPKEKKIFFHKDIFKYHNIRELEILKPWMLDDLTPETTQNVIIQIARFKKYCQRWDYTLGHKAFDRLMSVYKLYPDLKAEKAIPYIVSDGAYSGVTYLATRDQNIWTAIAPILTIHPKWESFSDKAGIITRYKDYCDNPLDTRTREPILQEDYTSNVNETNITRNQEDNIPF